MSRVPAAPAPQRPQQIYTPDTDQQFETHRDVLTANIDGALSSVGPVDTPDSSLMFMVNGYTTIEMRALVLATQASETAQIGIMYYPYVKPYKQVGILAAHVTLTFNGSTVTGRHPFNGDTEVSGTWYEASAESVTYKIHLDAIKGIPDPAGSYYPATGKQFRYLLDPLGYGRIYTPVVAVGPNVSRIIIGLKRASTSA